MTPTRPALLVALSLLASVIGWCAVQLFDALVGRTMPVPWSAPATLTVVAVSLLIWALLARPRLKRHVGAKPLSPFVAARTAALAMAASRTGALFGGFYLGAAAAFLSSPNNPVAREHVFSSAASVVASLLVVLAALWLEHICRLPDDPEADEAGNDHASGGSTGLAHPARSREQASVADQDGRAGASLG